MIIKKNIWTAFYLIVLGGTFLFMFLSYLKWQDIEEGYHAKYRNLTEIIGHSTRSVFDRDELMLEVLGTQLFENNTYENGRYSKKLFDQLLDKNPMFAGFILVDVNGELLDVSSNMDISKIPNFMKNPKTKTTFQAALESNDMVLGRTYYVKQIDHWLIPLRKSIRDKSGKVIGVVATGLKVNDAKGFLQKLHLAEDLNGIVLVKDFDKDKNLYRQFFSNMDVTSKEEIYEVPIPQELYHIVNAQISKKYGFSLNDLKLSGHIVSIETKDTWGRDMIAGLVYDEKYKLWVLVEHKASIVWEMFRKLFLIYTLIFILSLVVVYALFKYIANSEKTKQDELLFQVMHDDLTGLANRAYLYKYSDMWIERLSKSFDMLFIDLDNFKSINDVFGHHIGDKVLIEVAGRLRSCFEENSLLLRQGGDKFVVLKNCDDKEDFEKQLESLINNISLPYNVENLSLNVGVSIGVARYSRDADNIDELLSLAEIAMYKAKKRKNAYSIFSAEMKEASNYKVDMEQELRTAISNDEMWMVYQPQIHADGTLHGVEALVRWKNEKLGFVPPDKFIGVAEEMGLMPKLGAFIVHRSLQEIKALQDEMKMEFQLSINISVRQLIEVDFLKHFLDELEACGFDKTLVTLEVTESLFIEDIDYILPLLIKIKTEGINLSLDDFGTGYSSLSMLRKLPINELKIDKSFVDEILHNKEDKAMVESIIRMGKNLSMETLAEGVETVEQADMLRTFGCDIFQGYYFSKPLDREQLEIFLQSV